MLESQKPRQVLQIELERIRTIPLHLQRLRIFLKMELSRLLFLSLLPIRVELLLCLDKQVLIQHMMMEV